MIVEGILETWTIFKSPSSGNGLQEDMHRSDEPERERRERTDAAAYVNEKLAKRRLQWYGHCSHMEKHCWPKILLEEEDVLERSGGGFKKPVP